MSKCLENLYFEVCGYCFSLSKVAKTKYASYLFVISGDMFATINIYIRI